jgi:regulator of replication initiation timing
MDEQEKEFLMTINELRLQVSLRNTEIVDLHRKNKILRAEIAVLRDKLSRIQFPDTTGQ